MMIFFKRASLSLLYLSLDFASEEPYGAFHGLFTPPSALPNLDTLHNTQGIWKIPNINWLDLDML